MKIYISGKVTGLPWCDVRDNFEKAQRVLEEKGYKVINPLNNGLLPDDEQANHMRADIKLLMDCDAIYMQSNWIESRGAWLEREIAGKLGYRVINERDLL